MVSKQDLLEIRSRDFLENKDHFGDFDQVTTKLVLGKRPEEPVFLTIILPVYDHPQEFIRRAIRSALNQPCSYDFQLLVIDDYAKQTTPTETELFLRELNSDKVAYYKNQQNLGVFGNWNRAISLSNSTWISFLHSDDFLQDHYLENMARIVNAHPEIDQLCCNYKMLDFLHNEIVPNQEYKGHGGKRRVRRIKPNEYLYQMITSVKGSFYKREKLIELGGFRSQGDGLGLDDYPLMLRYAHYYKTYLLEDTLYLNSWGYNDSLNTKHWYPELIANYYMWLYFAEKENPISRWFYKKRARHLLIQRAIAYSDGTSWVGIPIDIDFEALKRDCRLQSLKVNPVAQFIVHQTTRVLNALKKYPLETFHVDLTESQVPSVVE